MHAPQCSQWHYLQLPTYENNPSVHQQMTEYRCGVCLFVCVCVYTNLLDRSLISLQERHVERSGQLWESRKGVWLSVVAETLDEISRSHTSFFDHAL